MRWRCAAQRGGDRGQEVDGAGQEQQHGGEPSDAPHPDVVGRHLGRGRPRGAARPARSEFGMDVSRFGSALHHGVSRDQPFAHGGHREIGLGEEQAHVQLRPRFDLERGLLAVVQERRREPQATPVFVDDLGGGTRAGEEADVEVGELGHEGPADDDAGGTGLDGGARRVERVLPVQFQLVVCDGPSPRGVPGPGRRKALAAERPPDAARRDGDHEGEDGEQDQGDHDGDGEAGGPGGAVGPLERRLLARRAEDAPEPVDDELEPQQERDDGQHERRRPEVATQSPVEHTGRDESACQHRIVEAVDAGEPGPIVGRCGLDRGIAVRAQRAGADEHSPRARSRLAREVDPVAHRDPTTLQLLHQGGIAFGRRHDDDHLGVGPGGEGRERVGQVCVVAQCAGGVVVAPRRRQSPAQDHDAGPLPFGQPAGDVATGGAGAVGWLVGKQEVADDLHPPAEADRQ